MGILVTGGTGFIGSNIVEALLGGGHDVLVLSNTPPTARQRTAFTELAGSVTFREGDVRDQQAIEALIRDHGIEQVIHAAVVTSNAERERAAGPMIVDINLVGAAAMATASANAGVKRFVLVGSAGVYDTQAYPDGQIIGEDEPHHAETLYAIGKSAAEAIVRRICTLNNLPFCIGRVATAFGPWERDTGFRDTLSPIWQLTRMAQQGGTARLARDKTSNWHYGPDAGAAIARLATSGTRYDNYNLGPQFAWPLSRWCELLGARFPAFRWEIGEPANVELYGGNDGGLLSWDRFTAEFGATARYDVAEAFKHYTAWLKQD